jgi:hypothetical protein
MTMFTNLFWKMLGPVCKGLEQLGTNHPYHPTWKK